MKIELDGFNIYDLSKNTISMMCYLYEYLENGWKIKKRDDCYIITKNNNKIYTLENIPLKNSQSYTINSKKTEYIMSFLYISLINKWSIKKNNENYIFIKNHGGKKEIFSDKYLHTFFEENFNFKLIK